MLVTISGFRIGKGIMETINFISFIIFALVFSALIVDLILIRIKNKKIANELIQAHIDKNILLEKLNRVILDHSAEKTDGFLRFVAESREQAFKYIEDTQEAIKIFDEEIGPIIKEYKKTGKPAGRSQKPLLDKLVVAYDIVMSLMPEES